MRKYLLISLLLFVWFVAMGAVGKRWDERYGYFETTHITKTINVAQNNYVLLPVVAGLRYVIYSTVFSAAGTATYYYGNDTGVAGDDGWGRLYSGGVNSSAMDDRIHKLDVSAALYTNFGGASFIDVEYRLE